MVPTIPKRAVPQVSFVPIAKDGSAEKKRLAVPGVPERA